VARVTNNVQWCLTVVASLANTPSGWGKRGVVFFHASQHYYYSLVCDMDYEAIWRRIKLIPF
jgi:hypothetical protein